MMEAYLSALISTRLPNRSLEGGGGGGGGGGGRTLVSTLTQYKHIFTYRHMCTPINTIKHQ